MKILVPCKRVPDPDQKLRLNAEAVGIDTNALTYILNPFDAIAVEEALRIRETAHPDAEVIAVSITPAEGEADLRTALAMRSPVRPPVPQVRGARARSRLPAPLQFLRCSHTLLR